MIYKVRADRDHYMNAYISADEIEMSLGDYFLLDEEHWLDFWKPLNVTFADDSDSGEVCSIPDITIWGTTANLVCTLQAKESIGTLLSSYGEWLPVVCEGRQYQLFHPTNKLRIDSVDLKNSSRHVDAAGYVEAKKIALNVGILEKNPVFQTEYNNYQNLYCSEEFKDQVARFNLSGLVFKVDHSNAP